MQCPQHPLVHDPSDRERTALRCGLESAIHWVELGILLAQEHEVRLDLFTLLVSALNISKVGKLVFLARLFLHLTLASSHFVTNLVATSLLLPLFLLLHANLLLFHGFLFLLSQAVLGTFLIDLTNLVNVHGDGLRLKLLEQRVHSFLASLLAGLEGVRLERVKVRDTCTRHKNGREAFRVHNTKIIFEGNESCISNSVLFAG